MRTLTLAAPAKINLYLEILGKRADGFHGLETLFQTIELADQVCVAVDSQARGLALTVSGADLGAPHQNLAWRAAEAYLALRSDLGAVRIALSKRIPHGAGLGGGSSDAAAVLRALVQLDPTPLSASTVHELACRLGSDVPFFLIGGTAWADGRGEQLTPLPDLPAQPITVLMPPTVLPTPRVFAALTEAERGPRTALGAEALSRRALSDLPSLLHNRLTNAARRSDPHVEQVLEYLAHCSLPHLLSGSGAACFALGTVAPPPGVSAIHSVFRSRARLNVDD